MLHLLEQSNTRWDAVMQIKQFLRQQKDEQLAAPYAIVNVSSVYGLVGAEGQATYVASKHAVCPQALSCARPGKPHAWHRDASFDDVYKQCVMI